MGQAMSNPCCGRERIGDRDSPCMPLRRITALQDARVHFINDSPMMCVLRDNLSVCIMLAHDKQSLAHARRTRIDMSCGCDGYSGMSCGSGVQASCPAACGPHDFALVTTNMRVDVMQAMKGGSFMVKDVNGITLFQARFSQ